MTGGGIDPGADIGHVHLKVADLDRAVEFYRDVIGFDLMQRLGNQAAFLSAGGYHHPIGLNTWERAGGSPPPDGNGIELYWDRPREAWPRAGEGVAMFSAPLDLEGLLAEP